MDCVSSPRAEERRIRSEAEKQHLSAQQAAATNKSWNDWFTSSFEHHLAAAMKPREGLLGDVLARWMAMERDRARDEWEQKSLRCETGSNNSNIVFSY
jgi:hypothetical protein